MNLIGTLSPWQWLLLAAVPPAVLSLYFLKLRRLPRDVPSTFLWQKTIEDMHVNSLWQKLKTSLLLLLQMLFLAFLIIACMRPGVSGTDDSGDRLVLLIDNSASMNAVDVGESRLEMAKELAKEQIDAMNDGDVAMIIAFSDRADVRQSFTEDRRQLRLALDAIQGTNRKTSIDEALRAAAGLANPGRASFDNVNDIQVAEAQPADLLIYSDGGFQTIEEFDFGNLTATYIPIGDADTANVSIAAFSVDRNVEKPEQIEAYARIANHGNQDVSVDVSLFENEDLIDAATVDLTADSETGVNFAIETDDVGELRVEIEYADALPLDNVAYAAIRPLQEKRVLFISPGNTGFETALETDAVQRLARVKMETPDYLDSEDYAQDVSSGSYDLIIYDQCSPAELPLANTLFMGETPPGNGWSASELDGPIFILDINRAHPMIEYLKMSSVRIVEGRSLTPPEGGQALMTANIGTVMAIAPRGAFQDAAIGFSVVNSTGAQAEVNSDWAIKRSFPVFVYSATKFLTGGSTSTAASTVLPGEPMGMRLQNSIDRYVITKPDQTTTSIQRGLQPQLIYTQTETLGKYRVTAEDDPNDRILEVFTVNLFSNLESDLRVKDAMTLGEDKVAGTTNVVQKRFEYWRYLLLLGLAVLFFEWLVYNRRVFV